MGGKKNRGFLAAAIGIVAAVAIPFAAPIVAGAVFGSTATLAAVTATGAVLGAGAGALSGSITGDMGRGALTGAAGGAIGGFVGGGGIGATQNALFGPGTETAVSFTRPELATVAPTEAATYFGPGPMADGAAFQAAGGVPGGMSYETLATAPIATSAPGGAASGIGSSAGTAVPAEASFGQRFYAGLTGQPVGGAAAAAPASATGGAGLATGSAPGFSASVAQPAAPGFFTAEGFGRTVGNLASGLTTPSGLASVGQLAMTMYNKPPEGLTPEERAYVDETSRLAGTNREMFDQRVSAARRLLQQGTANPEQAYAQANLNAQRRGRESGDRSESDVRRYEIRGAELGAAAIPGEYARAATATTAGLNAMPTTAPAGPATYALAASRSDEERRRAYNRDLASSFGGLANAFRGSSQKSLFS